MLDKELAEKEIFAAMTSELDNNEEILHFIKRLHLCLVKINLDTGCAFVLHSALLGEEGNRLRWDDYVEEHIKSTIMPQDHNRARYNFSLGALQQAAREKRNFFSEDFAIYNLPNAQARVSFLIYIPPEDPGIAYFALRNELDNSLMSSIVNQFVYENSDYFIYLDANTNSYITFAGKEDALLPPTIATDYETEVVNYALKFVALEDQAKTIENMHIPRIIEQLDKHGFHSFHCGIVNPETGEYRRKQLTYRYHNRELKTILLARTDITTFYNEMKEQQNKLEVALIRAQTDPLTKLWNVQATMDKINDICRALKDAAKYAGPNREIPLYGLLFIDLDNFKGINDSFGHPAGDQVLRDVSKALADATPQTGITGRVGGDEFVVFAQVDSIETLKELGRQLNLSINSIEIAQDSERLVSGSVGIAVAPEDGTTYYELLKKADVKLYKAKHSGKNQYYI